MNPQLLAIVLVLATAFQQNPPAKQPPATRPVAPPQQMQAPMPRPVPAPEMQKLTQMLMGMWTSKESFQLPRPGTGQGMESYRPGPGGLSLIGDYHSNGTTGFFMGQAILAWQPSQNAYSVVWVDNMNPGMDVTLCTWQGPDLVCTGSNTFAGQKVEERATYTNIKPDSFTWVLEMGPDKKSMKEISRVEFTKATPAQRVTPPPPPMVRPPQLSAPRQAEPPKPVEPQKQPK